jgi:hypothetical protein
VLVDDEAEAKLIAGLAEENPTLFKLSVAPREDDTESESFRELMSEVDRAIAGFEKTTKGLGWLGEAGLNADERLVREAVSAKDAGDRQSAVALLDFVADAVEVDAGGGRSRSGDVVTLRLPGPWTPGLADIPGYDAEIPQVRLTTNPATTQDGDGPIGYLGRAHPLVRRALDRVRNLQFGAATGFDRRVSAAAWDGPPAVLWTFLGTVRNELGRAFERVLAVRATATGTHVVADPEEWEALAKSPVVTAGAWERDFASWAGDTEPASRSRASSAFAELAGAFRAEQAEVLAGEEYELATWLEQRTEAICGPVEQAHPGLFAAAPVLPAWKTLRAADQRLAAFATEGANSAAPRREAETALKLYRDRVRDLQRRRPLDGEVISPLGLLMLVPRGA